jgi:hypothetical protein
MGKRGPAPLPAEVHLAAERTGRTDTATAHRSRSPANRSRRRRRRIASAIASVRCGRSSCRSSTRAGVLDGADVFALEAMVIAVARAILADELMRAHDLEHGLGSALVVRGDRGYVQHPLVKISRDAWAEARAWFAKFGATPSDRVGLAIGGLQGLTLAEQLERALNGPDAIAKLTTRARARGRALRREPQA